MSYDFKPKIDENIKILSELAKNSQDMVVEFQKSVKEQSVQVGDYQLPLASGDSIESINKLDSEVSLLEFGNFSSLVEGAKVPTISADLESITPDELLAALCSIKEESLQEIPIIPSITREDLQSVEFCKPEEPPAPQITLEDFKKLCEAIAPPAKPSKVLEENPNPNIDDEFADIFTIPEDNQGDLTDRNNQLESTLKDLEKLASFGDPVDVLSEELTKSDLGLILSDAADNFRNNDGLTSNQIQDLLNSVKNVDLDSINQPPPRPDEKVSIDCVKILQPIIQESQKKAERFGKVKTEIANIKQEANIGRVFISFWKVVDDTFNDPKNKGLLDLSKQKDIFRKEREATSIINIFKRNSLQKKIDEITKQQLAILKKLTNKGGLDSFGFLFSVSKSVDKIVKDLSIEIDIKYDKFQTPLFSYDKSKISQKSDRRLQKLQTKLNDSVKIVDLTLPEGIDEIKKLQEDFETNYEKEITSAITELQPISFQYTIDSIISGGERLDFVKSKLKEIYSNLKATYEPKAKSLEDLQKEEIDLQDYMDNLNTTIKDSLREQGCELPEINIPIDESGLNIDYKGIPMNADTSPNIFDIRWWRKFCVLASIVNLAPIHWPVGLILPTIPKPLFIPCPIIWTPLAVFNTPIALIVILIGQCGILPSPFVFVLNTAPVPLGPLNARSGWFPIAIRPMCKIKDNVTSEKLPAAPEILLPLANPEDIKKQIEILRKRIEENNKKIEQNSAEIQRLKEENQKYLQDITNYEARITAELERQKQRLEDLKKASEQNAQENAELSQKIADANKSIEDANKAAKEADEQIKKNEKEVSDAGKAAQNAKNAADEAKKKVDSATKKKNELLPKLENLESQYEAAKSNPILAASILAQIVVMKSEIDSIQQDIIKADQEAGKAIDEAEKAREKVLKANAELKNTIQKIKAAQEKAKEARDKVNALTKQQAELAKRNGELNTKISENGKESDSQNAIGIIRDKIASNNKKIQDLIKENAKLYQTNVQLQAKILELSLVVELSANQRAKVEIDPAITALLPLYKDDLPTWQRLSLLNIPFILFLWQWCAAGKNGGGFLRDPI